MFSRIGAVILLVSDTRRSIKFYKDVLGMELKQRSKDWVEFSKQGYSACTTPYKKKENEKK